MTPIKPAERFNWLWSAASISPPHNLSVLKYDSRIFEKLRLATGRTRYTEKTAEASPAAMNVQAFVSRRVVTPEGIRPAAIIVESGKIRELAAPAGIPNGAELHDFGNAAILPGLIDAHVHINDPGRAHWEGFETATRAAASGGFTFLVDMPLNSVPATTSPSTLAAKRAAAAGRCWVDWAAWGGVVADNQNEVGPLAAAGVRGFKCFLVPPGIEEFTMVTERELRAALPHVARSGLPLLVHAELPEAIEAATANLENADWSSYQTYLQSRPQESELAALTLLLGLCREYKFRLHIVHLSASQALPMLRAAKSEGLPVTVETCPHYLHFYAETIPDRATQFKCAPPIRGRDNREELWDGLRDGTIDLIATDHSPCPPEMKRFAEGNFQTAWGGIPGLSLALPVIHTEALARGFSLLDIVRWMAEGPAKLAGCEGRKGRLAAGHDADLTIFDDAAEFTVTAERLHHRHSFSPYLDEKLCGEIAATYVRGHLVYAQSRFFGKPLGKELRNQGPESLPDKDRMSGSLGI
jgi:allantoinase